MHSTIHQHSASALPCPTKTLNILLTVLTEHKKGERSSLAYWYPLLRKYKPKYRFEQCVNKKFKNGFSAPTLGATKAIPLKNFTGSLFSAEANALRR